MDREQELKGHIDHLNETQGKAFVDFKAKVQAAAIISEQSRWCDDATLLFLRARGFEVKAAFNQFSNTCQWRKDKNVDSLYENFDVREIEGIKSLLPQWTGKTDKMGRGVYVYKIANLNGKRTSELLNAKVEDRYDSM